MTVILSPELEQLIAEKIESGEYSSPNEVIAHSLRLLKEQDVVEKMRFEELRRAVNLGFDQIERGEGTTYSSAAEFAEKIKSAGRARLAAHQKAGA